MGVRMMILWTPHQRRNPILSVARTLDARDYANATLIFDEANGLAWMRAGKPNDEPGSEWWAWETEAQRFLERWFRP
jgi:hypothetical protein